MRDVSVWAVHLMTASGAALALVAALAAARVAWQIVVLYLGITMVIDGPLAHRVSGAERIP